MSGGPLGPSSVSVVGGLTSFSRRGFASSTVASRPSSDMMSEIKGAAWVLGR